LGFGAAGSLRHDAPYGQPRGNDRVSGPGAVSGLHLAVQRAASSTVVDTETQPFVAHRLVMPVNLVELDGETQIGGGETSDLAREGELRDRKVVLGGDQLHAVGEQLLLGVEHVENGARADGCFLPDAVESDIGGPDRRFQRDDLCPSGNDLLPGLRCALDHGAARIVGLTYALPDHRLKLYPRCRKSKGNACRCIVGEPF
jgi:hypothetical protein